MKKHIYLNGFMGAGKSRVGRELFHLSKRPFYDVDYEIVKQTGMQIETIFQQQGEAHFRALETEMIRNLSKMEEPAIIALGGGAFTNKNNRDITQKHGTVFYLKSKPKAILERVKHNDKRPLLRVERNTDFEKNLLKKIEVLLATREQIYMLSDKIIERDNMEAAVVAQMILQLMKEENA